MKRGCRGGSGAYADAGRQECVSRISLCSRPHRPIGTGSYVARSRSVMEAKAVAELGLEGMKYTLQVVSKLI